MSAQDPEVTYARLVIEVKVPSSPEVDFLKGGGVIVTTYAAPHVQCATKFDDRIKALEWAEELARKLRKGGPGGALLT